VLQASTTTTLVVTWDNPGDYEIEVRAVSDCGTGNPSTLDVTVYPDPHVDLGNDTTILQGQTLVLDAGNPGCTYLWSTGASTQTISVNQAGTYWVTASNYCGDDSDTIEVSVETGIPSYSANFNGKIYYNGSRIIIEPKKENILDMKLSDLAGRILYEGKYRKELTPGQKGLLILMLSTDKGLFYRKIVVY
jgi:hypothetical protein